MRETAGTELPSGCRREKFVLYQLIQWDEVVERGVTFFFFFDIIKIDKSPKKIKDSVKMRWERFTGTGLVEEMRGGKRIKSAWGVA